MCVKYIQYTMFLVFKERGGLSLNRSFAERFVRAFAASRVLFVGARNDRLYYYSVWFVTCVSIKECLNRL